MKEKKVALMVNEDDLIRIRNGLGNYYLYETCANDLITRVQKAQEKFGGKL